MLNPAESLLARLTDPTRAAAIYGDLTELAQTRGRLWFWLAYVRTLLSVSWRPLAAFAAAAIVFAVLYDRVVFPALWFFAMGYTHVGELIGQLSLQLCFLVPFAGLRYGIRSRVTQLGLLASLVAVAGVAVALRWQIGEALFVFVPMGAIIAIAITPWRQALWALWISCALGMTIMEASERFDRLYRSVPGLRQQFPVIPALVSMIAVVIVFSFLHRRFLRPQPTGGAHA